MQQAQRRAAELLARIVRGYPQHDLQLWNWRTGRLYTFDQQYRRKLDSGEYKFQRVNAGNGQLL